MRLRAELRTRWRAWLALALVFGIGAGSAIAALAGARRTDTAYPRFERAQDAFDAISGGGGSAGFAERFEALKHHPAVEDYTELVIVSPGITIPAGRGREEANLVPFLDLFLMTDPAGRALYETNRAKVLEGRLPDRSRVDEVTVPFTVAERYGLRLGDEIIGGIGFDFETFGPLRDVRLRVVGIHAAPGDFEGIGQALFLAVFGTPALYQEYREVMLDHYHDEEIVQPQSDQWTLAMHLKGGAQEAARFKQVIEGDLNLDIPVIEPIIRSSVQKTIRLYTAAVWLIGSLIAVATVAIIGQTIARQQSLDATEYPTLYATGFSRRQLVGLGMLRAVIMGFVAAVTAAVVAYLLSPLTPIGPARIAEPEPGLAFDGVAIGLGAAAVLLLVPLISVLPSVRVARAASRTGDRAESTLAKPSSIVGTVARASRSPATTTGLRMALEPGRGRTAVPVRSTILAVALGIAAVSGSVVVGRSLTHLIENPALTGYTYDAIAIIEGDEDGPRDPAIDIEHAKKLSALPFVDDLAFGTAVNVVFAGEDSFLIGFNDGASIGYAVIDGRAPTDVGRSATPEIALGPETLRRMRLHIGDTVEFGYPDPAQSEEELEAPIVRRLVYQRAAIVGVAAIPPLPWAVTEPGEGAIMSATAVERFNLGDRGGCCFVSFKPGGDLNEARRQLEDAGFQVFLRVKRTDVATLERISRLPIVLSGLFAAIAAAALAHVLVTSIRRRRRDLAILKTLGFVQRQVRGAVAWNVSVITLLSVAIGIPVGLVLGRWGWRLIANQFGVVPVSVAPVLLLALVLPAALVLGNLVAAVPGRFAARTQPALVLRAE
jgi:hypothetical protein